MYGPGGGSMGGKGGGVEWAVWAVVVEWEVWEEVVYGQRRWRQGR